MVSDANRPGLEVGGHIATYQSAASLYEVGFNHFFRGKDHPGGGDQIYIQGHGSPGIYARAFLEGRLDEQQLLRFRQEVQHGVGKGLSSYPHPRLMPEFWEFPTVSMGLTGINSIYQARFNRYLQNRGIKDTSAADTCGRSSATARWPSPSRSARSGSPPARSSTTSPGSSTATCSSSTARSPATARSSRSSRPTSAAPAGTSSRSIWGREWDELLARDVDGVLVNQMNKTPDGAFQTYSVEDGAYNREHFFGADPRLRTMVEHMSDRQIEKLPRGGHDYRKVYAAFDAASKHTGQPTVILAHTIKGWTIEALEGKNATHQMKKLKKDDLKKFRDRLYLPMSDRDIDEAYEATGTAPFFHPGADSPEIEYMLERRRQLGGSLPKRVVRAKPLNLPGASMYDELKQGSGKNKIATTMATVRLLKDWMKDPDIGQRIVPIAPDEYRTFGMDSMFPSAKVYNPAGQLYEAVDRKLLLVLQGVRAGPDAPRGHLRGRARWPRRRPPARRTRTHGEHMIPFYIFYSMFGFQRTGDSIWAMADQLARGFLIGATAGRTTLTGEGLQHADGHSPLLAATNPAVVHYDPAFAYEVAHIMESGLTRMYGETEAHPHGEDVIFYITVYNEPVSQPKEPDDVDVEGILKGIHKVASAEGDGPAGARCWPPASATRGSRRPPGSCARTGASAPTCGRSPRGTSWPATPPSAEEWNLLHPGESPRTAYVADRLAGVTRPGRRGVGLHARRAAPDRPLGARRLPGPRRRRLRLRRHPPRRPPVLPHRRPVGRRPGAPGARRRRRDRPRPGREGVRGVPDRRPDRRRRRQAGGRRRLAYAAVRPGRREFVDRRRAAVETRAARAVALGVRRWRPARPGAG